MHRRNDKVALKRLRTAFNGLVGDACNLHYVPIDGPADAP